MGVGLIHYTVPRTEFEPVAYGLEDRCYTDKEIIFISFPSSSFY